MKSSQVVIVEGIKGGGLGHYIGLAAIRRLKVPNEPLWASVSPITRATPKGNFVGLLHYSKKYDFVCREQGGEIFLCLSLLCCFICSWGEGTLYCQRPWSHVSNPDPDLKCLKCQIFHLLPHPQSWPLGVCWYPQPPQQQPYTWSKYSNYPIHIHH